MELLKTMLLNTPEIQILFEDPRNEKRKIDIDPVTNSLNPLQKKPRPEKQCDDCGLKHCGFVQYAEKHGEQRFLCGFCKRRCQAKTKNWHRILTLDRDSLTIPQKKRYDCMKIVEEHKMNIGKCQRCLLILEEPGFPSYCFDMDHRDPSSKTLEISIICAIGKKKLLESELSKCDMLCYLCHFDKTSTEKRGGRPRSKDKVVKEMVTGIQQGANLEELDEMFGISGFCTNSKLVEKWTRCQNNPLRNWVSWLETHTVTPDGEIRFVAYDQDSRVDLPSIIIVDDILSLLNFDMFQTYPLKPQSRPVPAKNVSKALKLLKKMDDRTISSNPNVLANCVLKWFCLKFDREGSLRSSRLKTARFIDHYSISMALTIVVKCKHDWVTESARKQAESMIQTLRIREHFIDIFNVHITKP